MRRSAPVYIYSEKCCSPEIGTSVSTHALSKDCRYGFSLRPLAYRNEAARVFRACVAPFRAYVAAASLRRAQTEASARTGSAERDQASRVGRKRGKPLLPMAMATLRSKPSYLARLMGEPEEPVELFRGQASEPCEGGIDELGARRVVGIGGDGGFGLPAP